MPTHDEVVELYGNVVKLRQLAISSSRADGASNSATAGATRAYNNVLDQMEVQWPFLEDLELEP